MRADEYVKYDATGLAELVANGDVTAPELLAAAREQAARINPEINAIVMDLGAEADQRAAADLDGPFAGVPFLIKDLGQEYKGFPTSYGSRALAKDVATEHATVVQRWLDAGLVIFGKTNTPEFGAKGITEPELWGPARNPWNTGHTTGGSSGGSGAAVAAGIVPAAGANDGGGSIRIPAAANGLVGLKPSRGLAPYGPRFGEPMFGMAVQGSVSRTVRDNAALLDAIIGNERTSEYLAAGLPESLTDAIKSPPRKLRIGFSWSSAINPAPDGEAIRALEEAAILLESLGHEIEPVDPPYDDAQLARDFLTIWFAVLAAEVEIAKLETGAKDKDFESDTIAIAELGRAGGTIEPALALNRRHEYVRAMADFHQEFDLFLTPTLAKQPPKIGEMDTPPALQKASRVIGKLNAGKVLERVGILDEMIGEQLGWVPYTQLANLTGRPAISVPLHWSVGSGLPIGVQFVGQLGDEGLLLQLAAQLEEAQPWAPLHPAIAVPEPALA